MNHRFVLQNLYYQYLIFQTWILHKMEEWNRNLFHLLWWLPGIYLHQYCLLLLFHHFPLKILKDYLYLPKQNPYDLRRHQYHKQNNLNIYLLQNSYIDIIQIHRLQWTINTNTHTIETIIIDCERNILHITWFIEINRNILAPQKES